jgi:citrate lyase subunit alpha / citrate CoA-transferase
MLHAGLFRTLFDVQCFDLEAVESFRRDDAHLGMSASMYANPHNRGAVVNQLDTMILGATEIDVDFNVNVTTGTDGVIMGGSGGHADTAAGAKLALITSRLNAGGYAKVVDQVGTITTPGETVDVLVTERGVAVNPRRKELRDRLVEAGLDVRDIDELKSLAARGAVRPRQTGTEGRPVAVVEYRDGTVSDVVGAIP